MKITKDLTHTPENGAIKVGVFLIVFLLKHFRARNIIYYALIFYICVTDQAIVGREV
jgi:hypothetical protein